MRIIPSSYVTDEYGVRPCIEIIKGEEIEKPTLNSMIEEADCPIIPHIEKAIINYIERVITYSNNADVVMYLLYYVHQFKDLGIKELWIKYGTRGSTRYIRTYKLPDIMGSSVCKFVLKAHVLPGCDVTSKVGTKAAALENTHENYLRNFGETTEVTRESFALSESCLAQILQKNSTCVTFNELRWGTLKLQCFFYILPL